MISLSLGDRKEELELLKPIYLRKFDPTFVIQKLAFFKTKEIKFSKTPSFHHNLMRKLLAVHISCFIKW